MSSRWYPQSGPSTAVTRGRRSPPTPVGLTWSHVAPPLLSHWPVYNPGNETHGVVTVTPGTLVVALGKNGESGAGALEKSTGFTHATCSPFEVVWPDWRLTP